MPAAPWLAELGLRPDGPPWLSMGLSRVGDAAWLLPDEHRDAELAERRRLLDERHDDVFMARPGTDEAGQEVLDLVSRWLATYGPSVAAAGPGDPADPTVAAHGDSGGRHPLEQAGGLVQEDLALMVPRDGHFHLDAACLCFPSHWRLIDKLGGSAAAIHGPVPGYEAELEAKVDRFLDRLRPGTISARRNWSVHDDPALFAPVPPAQGRPLSVDGVGRELWLRSERQTLRRLPRSQAVLFTIRVQQTPFESLVDHPAVAAKFAARLRAQPAELTEMNGLAPYRDVVIGWLDHLAG